MSSIDTAPSTRARRRHRLWAIAVTLLAIGGAEILYHLRVEPITFDAAQYLELARDIERDGLFGYTTPLARYRTYGYPLLVRLVAGPWGLADETVVRWVVFHTQLALLLAGAAAAGVVFARIREDRRFGLAVFATIALNPFLMAHTVSLTSDLSSAVVCLMATLAALPFASTPATITASAALAAGLAGSAVMLRPANLSVLVAIAILLGIRVLRRHLRWRTLPLVVAVGALPFLPQILTNGRLDERFHVLLVDDLYAHQLHWGMQLLKYATAVAPGSEGGIRYVNPFYDGQETVGQFLGESPIGYVATLLLHAFAMVDHDHLFIYVTDLHPWYRWPAAWINFTFLGLAIGSIARLRDRTTRGVGTWASNGGALLLVGGCYTAAYLPSAVESRFGLVIDLLLAPFAVLAAERLWERRRDAPSTAAWLVAFVGAGSCVSWWLQRQAPMMAGLAPTG